MSLSSGSVSVNPHVDEEGRILETPCSNHMLGLHANPMGGILEAPVTKMRTFGKSICISLSSTLVCLPPETMVNTSLISHNLKIHQANHLQYFGDILPMLQLLLFQHHDDP